MIIKSYNTVEIGLETVSGDFIAGVKSPYTNRTLIGKGPTILEALKDLDNEYHIHKINCEKYNYGEDE